MRQISLFMLAGLLALLTALTGASLAAADTVAVQAELPRHFVNTAYKPPEGEVLRVAAGDDFQAALDRARPGDVIELEAGAVFEGPFTLPRKDGDDWIVIRSSRSEDGLPGEGERVSPEHASLMPKLVAISGAVIRTEPGAHHYRFIGIEAYPDDGDNPVTGALRSMQGVVTRNAGVGDEGVFLYNLIELGSGNESSLDQLPHHIIFDRCYLHGDPKAGTRRGVAMNGRHMAVIDSHLADFKEVGADAQAIAGWNGAGPFKIVNNYLEGAGENVLFGGADPEVENLVPSDIVVRRNHFFKPLAWRAEHDDYQGTAWTVKNLFELKNARRVLVEGNLFEHNWPHAQAGMAILFTVRNQEGGAPWSVVEDVTFTNNVIRKVGAGVNILGHDDNYPSRQTTRVVISNNLFEQVGGEWGGGRLFQLLEGSGSVFIDNNTALNTGQIMVSDGAPTERLVFTNNIVRHNDYGIIGSDTAPGNQSLDQHFKNTIVRGNVMVGAPAGSYPEANAFPVTIEDVGFVDPEKDYRLDRESDFVEGLNDRSGDSPAEIPGVDFAALCAALAETERPSLCEERG